MTCLCNSTFSFLEDPSRNLSEASLFVVELSPIFLKRIFNHSFKYILRRRFRQHHARLPRSRERRVLGMQTNYELQQLRGFEPPTYRHEAQVQPVEIFHVETVANHLRCPRRLHEVGYTNNLSPELQVVLCFNHVSSSMNVDSSNSNVNSTAPPPSSAYQYPLFNLDYRLQHCQPDFDYLLGRTSCTRQNRLVRFDRLTRHLQTWAPRRYQTAYIH
ncbi:hypothetical protein GALMADRAFT_771455 [Galerina marginata CBS 339.88]|uniref:Uncharacterized protein n=1 Tax=Galerina marginata (strain CBS 339.88) TaxID=685588 RepID=A0A067SND6_GALM3|nr:hypothetical protein GALMADRAFT_771455 [Galerina marginata CBS 339.88]